MSKKDDEQVTDDDLAEIKRKSEEVETPPKNGEDDSDDDAGDESDDDQSNDSEEDDSQTDDDSEEDSEDSDESEDKTDEDSEEDEDSDTFTKKYPQFKGDNAEEYAKNLEEGYANSSTEALKWKKLYEDGKAVIKKAEAIVAGSKDADKDKALPTNPALAYAQSQMEKEYNDTYKTFADKYPQVHDPEQFAVLEKKVKLVSLNIQQEENGRIPTLQECLDGAVELLKWDSQVKKDKVNAAVKDHGAQTKTNSMKTPPAKTKVSKGQIIAARGMFPGLSDTEIAKELEQYI